MSYTQKVTTIIYSEGDVVIKKEERSIPRAEFFREDVFVEDSLSATDYLLFVAGEFKLKCSFAKDRLCRIEGVSFDEQGINKLLTDFKIIN